MQGSLYYLTEEKSSMGGSTAANKGWRHGGFTNKSSSIYRCSATYQSDEQSPALEYTDVSDLTYRLHWATRHSELNNLKTLDLNSSIIQERHYAINWVTYYEGNWDDITTEPKKFCILIGV